MFSHSKRTYAKGLVWALLAAAAIEVLLIGLSYSFSSGNAFIKAKDGRIDISQWNYDGTFSLSGDWDFYWREFLNESDLQNNPPPDLTVSLPAVWNNYIVGGKKVGGIGYATYRLHVTDAKAGEPLAIRVAPLSTAYELYIDGRLTAKSGKVGETKEEHAPQYRLKVFEFTPDKDSFDIILHISNFTYTRGGAWYVPTMGTPEAIRHLDNMISSCEFFLFGSYFVMLLLCFYLYSLRRDKSVLLYAALCVLYIGRIVIYGAFFINTWFPSLPFAANVWIDYITLYQIPNFLLMLVHFLYPDEVSAKAVRLTVVYSATATLLTLASPVYFTTQLKNFALAAAVSICLYIIFALMLAVKREKPDTRFMLGGILTLVASGFLDIYQNIVGSYGYLEFSPIGFAVMMFVWGCVLAQRHVRALRAREQALLMLNVSNEEKRQAELKFLKSQIRPHFIHNALNTIISISRSDPDRARTLLVEFSKYLRGCYDFESLEDTVPVDNELAFVRAYMAIEKARFGDRLRVEYDIDDDVTLQVPPLILQPLVENAVLHGLRGKLNGGSILIYVKKTVGACVKVGVKDDGIGIDSDKMKTLLHGDADSRGVALYNINERLLKLYHTELSIIRLEGGGLDVSALIPKKGVE